MKHNPILAVLLVAAAAAIWGADSLIPSGALDAVPSPALTFLEHLFCLVLLVPVVLRRRARELRLLGWKHLAPLFMVGIAGETLASLFFGDSYRMVGGAAAGFLQMLQPFCVLGLVYFVGRERRGASYLQWALWILIGAFFIWLFDPSFEFLALEAPDFWRGAGMGFLAVMLWAASNVGAKILLEDFSPSTLVVLRFALSLVGLALVLAWRGIVPDPRPLLQPGAGIQFLVRALFFALFSSWLYYRGLRQLPASLASFVALACPLALVFLPGLLRAKPLHELQWLGGVSVLVGVLLLVRLELEFVSKGRKG